MKHTFREDVPLWLPKLIHIPLKTCLHHVLSLASYRIMVSWEGIDSSSLCLGGSFFGSISFRALFLSLMFINPLWQHWINNHLVTTCLTLLVPLLETMFGVKWLERVMHLFLEKEVSLSWNIREEQTGCSYEIVCWDIASGDKKIFLKPVSSVSWIYLFS